MRGEPRTLTTGTQSHTKVLCTDKEGPVGACHQYEIMKSETSLSLPLTVIQLQKGGVEEVGEVNGMFMEDLLVIVQDRLEYFQVGPFPCDTNQRALECIQEALESLGARTRDRQSRNVEGRSVA